MHSGFILFISPAFSGQEVWDAEREWKSNLNLGDACEDDDLDGHTETIGHETLPAANSNRSKPTQKVGGVASPMNSSPHKATVGRGERLQTLRLSSKLVAITIRYRMACQLTCRKIPLITAGYQSCVLHSL